LVALALFGCSKQTPLITSATEPFAAVSVAIQSLDHFTVVPVSVVNWGDVDNPVAARMIIDTGIGVTVLSRALCERLKCVMAGEHTGRRMSGQSVTVPLTRVSALTIGGRRVEDMQVGVVDAEGLLAPGIDGIVSLGFFAQIPFTLDYRAQALVLEDANSLVGRQAAGTAVAVHVERDGPSTSLFARMALPRGASAQVEIDTGSNSLILDERYMRLLGVDPADRAVEVVRGQDETSHGYLRHFASITGTIHFVDAPALQQDHPRVMFQKIIHDGLVGRAFLDHFTVTFDLPRSRIILAPLAAVAPPPTRL